MDMKEDMVMMKDGKMMMMKNGMMMPMEMDMTMSDGTKVMMDGKVMMKDGTTRMMMDGEAMTMDGKMTKFKSVTEIKDPDTMVFTMSSPGRDGKEQTMLTISYKRKK